MKRFVAAVFVMAMLAIPAHALAAQPPDCIPGYTCHNTGAVQDNGAARTQPGQGTVSPNGAVQAAGATRSAGTSTLPFTGIDVGLLAAGGVVLVGAGLLVRRFSTGS